MAHTISLESNSRAPVVFERFMIGLYGYQADEQPGD